jgi:acylphosphatase
MICKRMVVKGLVQGVYFRASTQQKAEELGVRGEVRNLADGSVEIVACGTEEQLQELLNWCRVGPRHAAVEQVIVSDLPEQDFKGFSIIRGRG